MFLDADDWLPSDYIRPCRAPLDAAPDVAFAFTQLHYFGDRDGGSSLPVFDPNRRKRGSCIPSSALMRSDVVRRHGYDVRLRHGLEDWAFYLTLAENGVAGVLVADTHVWYRVHGSSMGTACSGTGDAASGRTSGSFASIAGSWASARPSGWSPVPRGSDGGPDWVTPRNATR